MASFESGVQGYISGIAFVRVNFPVDSHGHAEIACKHCQFLSSNTRICRLNNKPVAYPMTNVGQYCPLYPEELNDITGEVPTIDVGDDKEEKDVPNRSGNH